MSVGRDALNDPRFATLDAPGVVELCTSLADYGEAGGLSKELMLQVGSFAEARFGRDVEVMLAVARMYLLGGETVRARTTLVRAGQTWPDESRVRPLLAHALKLLDDPRSVEEALGDAPDAQQAPAPRRSAPPPERIVPPRAQTPPGLPVVKLAPEAKPTTPRMYAPTEAQIRAAQAAARQGTPAARAASSTGTRTSRPPPRMEAPTPASGLPPVPRAPKVPRGMGEVITASGSASGSASGRAARLLAEAKGARGAAAARVPVEEAVRSAEVRTEVGRRAAPVGDPPPPDSSDPPRSIRNAGGVPRATRIRLLDLGDERRFLDPYELIGELASGGMATVFLGRLAGAGGFQRFVAIKRLHPHLAREEQFVEMFLDEARLAAGIHHPHVVPILEVGQSDAGYYLVMEFIEGDTLGGLIVRALQRGAGLPPNVAARIVLDALAGLHAAHQLTDGDGHYLGLVHRDCTPQNILVGIDGSARITDFGVARAASRLAITRPQQVKGKVAYLSPEQAHALELDRRSDIFTMGIVLWEALAGRPLFQGETEAATLSRLLSGQIPELRAYVPGVPDALDEVCRRALALDRNRRFRTSAEMAEALERAASADGFGGVASPRELGRFVESVMGAEIAAQREAVRSWLSQSEASPHSRAPRSLATSAGRTSGSAGPRRSVPPTTGVHPVREGSAPGTSVAPATQAPITPRSGDDAPETPAPMAEKVPRLSSIPPPLPRHAQLPEEVAVPSHAARPPAASHHDGTASGPGPQERAEPSVRAPEPEASDEAAEVPRPSPLPEVPRPSLAERATALAPPWLQRLAGMKISNRSGIVLVVAIVALAMAPLGYKLIKQQLRPSKPAPAASARVPVGKRAVSKAAAPPASGAPAWDEWPVPEGGAPAPDEAAVDNKGEGTP
ncbi:MAG: protein kinase [Minicystis sp.]